MTKTIAITGGIGSGKSTFCSKLKEKGFKVLGKVTAVLFAVFCIGGSFGGGNACLLYTSPSPRDP